MFQVIICRDVDNQIFKLRLMNGQELMGIIDVSKHYGIENHAALHLYIKSSYRKRWLTKSLAHKIFKSLIDVSNEKGILAIHSAALKKESARLLRFFHFEQYEDDLYILKMKD